VHLIDVREPQEFAAGTFKGSVNISVNNLEKCGHLGVTGN
jgi:rhodanese-related sulfurtransferase